MQPDSAEHLTDSAPQLAAGEPTPPPQDARRLRLLQVPVDTIDQVELWRRIDAAVTQRASLHIATTSVHFVSVARRHPRFARVLDGCELSLADGRLLQWVTALAGQAAPQQITGHDLFDHGIAHASRHGWRVFLLGGAPGVVGRVAARARAREPALLIDSTDGGRFDADGLHDDPALLARVRAFAPQLGFVALGAPKQELWIAAHRHALPPCVWVGVGGVFDTQAGDLPRAPRWMQRSGLESVFQLAVAPRRYARRYLLEDPPTLARLAADALAQRLRRSSTSA